MGEHRCLRLGIFGDFFLLLLIHLKGRVTEGEGMKGRVGDLLLVCSLSGCARPRLEARNHSPGPSDSGDPGT